MAWATAQDVLDRWVGAGQPTNQSVITTLIQDAEAYIRREYPSIDDRIDDGELNESEVVMVVAQLVLRKLQNPTGARQFQRVTGPFTEGMTFAGDAPGELWHLTEQERKMLGDDQSGGAGRAFTIKMGPY